MLRRHGGGGAGGIGNGTLGIENFQRRGGVFLRRPPRRRVPQGQPDEL